jgi:hypothetical protein
MYGIERHHLPDDPEGEHNALIDAKWTKDAYYKLKEVIAERPSEVIHW